VYLVERQELGRPFAAKLLHEALAQKPEHIDRLRLQAQALGRLAHPNIVSVWNFEHTRDGRPFLVMEYLEGRTLYAELAAHGALSVLDALVYACELCSALAAVHELGIVHRDITSENLFLYEPPSGERTLKMLDFGSARVLATERESATHPLVIPTATGHVVGTPAFISPEAARGERVDHRADIYGVGLVLYAMLAGRGPFDDAPTAMAALFAHAREQPVPPSRYARQAVPPLVEQAVLRALHKQPEYRQASAEELGQVLRESGRALLGPESWEGTLAMHSGILERTLLLAPNAAPPRAPPTADLETTPAPPTARSGAEPFLPRTENARPPPRQDGRATEKSSLAVPRERPRASRPQLDPAARKAERRRGGRARHSPVSPAVLGVLFGLAVVFVFVTYFVVVSGAWP
jgi:serine/threonine-protein kinase